MSRIDMNDKAETAGSGGNRRDIEYVDIAELVPADDNPKLHDLDTLRASYARFGFTAPVIVDDRTGKLVAGHGRVKLLLAERAAGNQAPDGIMVQGEEWKIPVIRGWRSKDDQDAAAYVLADNYPTPEEWWDDSSLISMLASLDDLAGTGMDWLTEMQQKEEENTVTEEIELKIVSMAHVLISYPIDLHGEVATHLQPLESKPDVTIRVSSR